MGICVISDSLKDAKKAKKNWQSSAEFSTNFQKSFFSKKKKNSFGSKN